MATKSFAPAALGGAVFERSSDGTEWLRDGKAVSSSLNGAVDALYQQEETIKLQELAEKEAKQTEKTEKAEAKKAATVSAREAKKAEKTKAKEASKLSSSPNVSNAEPPSSEKYTKIADATKSQDKLNNNLEKLVKVMTNLIRIIDSTNKKGGGGRGGRSSNGKPAELIPDDVEVPTTSQAIKQIMKENVHGKKDEYGRVEKPGFLRELSTAISPKTGGMLFEAADRRRDAIATNLENAKKRNAATNADPVPPTAPVPTATPDKKTESAQDNVEKQAKEAYSKPDKTQNVKVVEISEDILHKLAMAIKGNTSDNDNKNSPEKEKTDEETGSDNSNDKSGGNDRRRRRPQRNRRGRGRKSSPAKRIPQLRDPKTGRFIKSASKGLGRGAIGGIGMAAGGSAASAIGGIGRAAGGSAASAIGGIGMAAGGSAASAVTRGGAAVAGKAAEKSIGKVAAKVAGKTILKSLVKKIPVIGLIAGAGFAAGRALRGDFAGAGMELASGAASLVPGIGTAASLGIDAALAAKDIHAATSNVEKVDTPEISAPVPAATATTGPDAAKEKGGGILKGSGNFIKAHPKMAMAAGMALPGVGLIGAGMAASQLLTKKSPTRHTQALQESTKQNIVARDTKAAQPPVVVNSGGSTTGPTIINNNSSGGGSGVPTVGQRGSLDLRVFG